MSKNNKKKQKSKFKVLIGLLVLVAVSAALAFFGYDFMLSPVATESQDVNFLVSNNDNLSTVSKKLEEQGIIKSATLTKIAGKIAKVEGFVAGAFTLDKSWDSRVILDYLTKSSNIIEDEVTVTLREGLWAKEIAEKISLSLDLSQEDLLDLWNDETYVKSIMKDYPFLTEDIFNKDIKVILEGYLAPNTYNFFIDASADTVTKKILNQTLNIYNKYLDDFNASKYSTHEIFSLASLTQYESGVFEEDQVIAGIWYNRLDIGMKLESSVTVCYSLYEFEEWEDCERNTNIDSPYNTYKYPGIVPGPVTNPGENSIQATLKPKNTDYLFFLADVKGDSTIYYSETFEEHQRKVNKYLR